jgi:NADH-quinone oxidoreductase subunit J
MKGGVMSLYSILFYLLAIFILAATILAVTRKNPVHAVIFLIFSFLGSAMIYFLLGAPFLAAIQVIIYAGAIMVMFLFIIMTLKLEGVGMDGESSSRWSWLYGIILSGISLILLIRLLWTGPDHGQMLKPAMAAPKALGRILFREFWFPVEAASFLLFVALAGALYLSKGNGNRKKTKDSEQEAP